MIDVAVISQSAGGKKTKPFFQVKRCCPSPNVFSASSTPSCLFDLFTNHNTPNATRQRNSPKNMAHALKNEKKNEKTPKIRTQLHMNKLVEMDGWILALHLHPDQELSTCPSICKTSFKIWVFFSNISQYLLGDESIQTSGDKHKKGNAQLKWCPTHFTWWSFELSKLKFQTRRYQVVGQLLGNDRNNDDTCVFWCLNVCLPCFFTVEQCEDDFDLISWYVHAHPLKFEPLQRAPSPSKWELSIGN